MRFNKRITDSGFPSCQVLPELKKAGLFGFHFIGDQPGGFFGITFCKKAFVAAYGRDNGLIDMKPAVYKDHITISTGFRQFEGIILKNLEFDFWGSCHLLAGF